MGRAAPDASLPVTSFLVPQLGSQDIRLGAVTSGQMAVTRYQFDMHGSFSSTATNVLTSVLQGTITITTVPSVIYAWANVQWASTSIDNQFTSVLILDIANAGVNPLTSAMACSNVPLTVANVEFPGFISGSKDITVLGNHTLDLCGMTSVAGTWKTNINDATVSGARTFVHCLVAGKAL